jgi:hypothetical protein
MGRQLPLTTLGRSPKRPRALRVTLGVAVLAIVAAGSVVAQGPVQPDGSEPAPPFVEPEVLPQPDGSKPAPRFIEPEVIPQPANPHPDRKGASTQIAGPKEKVKGVDGQGGSSSKREDTGGVNGADAPGGRTD